MYPGLSLGDRYTLEDLIGTSTGGSVWTGHDTVLDRPVRIKVLGIALSAEESNRARFRQSTLEVTTLQVPGVIDVFDCVEHFDDEQILECQIAERVDGIPLSRILNERSLGTEGTLSLVATAAWVLNEAHEAGARHLNLKPTNLIVTPDGSVTITDFAYLPTAPTHPYAAPEQRRGESAGIPADVYSLGAIAYECVTGGPPTSDATLPDDTAPAIAAFIGRALSPTPAHRFGSAAILATECEQILHTSDVLDALLARSKPETESEATAPEPVVEPEPKPEPLAATAKLPKRTPLASAVEPPPEPDPEPLVAAAPEPVVEPDPEPEPLVAAEGPRPWDVEPEPVPPPVTVTMEWRDPKPRPIDPEPELLDPDEDPRLRDPKPRVRESAVPSHSHARKAKPRRKRLVLLAVVALAVVAATALTVTTLLPQSAATSAADDYDPGTDDSTESTTLSPSESKEDHDRGKSDDPTSDDSTSTSSSSSDKPSSPSPTKSSSSDDSPDPPQKVKVPNVVGDDKAAAISELKDADLQYNVIKSGEGDFECPIFDQSPDAGTSVVKGTTVDIELKLADNAEGCDDGGDEEPATKP